MTEILRENPSDGVALLRINRPERLNALSMSVREEMAQQFLAISVDPSIRCVVVTGDEKAFAAGADIVELGERKISDNTFERSRIAWSAIEKCPKPIIAAVNGFALGGGCELAMHCDIIIAGESAKLGQPEVKLGIMPGAGGTQRFVRAAGKFAAMRWVLTGDMLSAAEAKTCGLVSEVVADADVLPHSLKLAAKIAALPPIAVMAIKDSIINGADVSLPAALSLERKAFQLLFATQDKDEGISAFVARRKPQFKGL
jgi:enoyl-CoA hydratase